LAVHRRDGTMAQNNVQQIEPIEHPASGQGREFPPFEKQTFPSQLFWLALTFILLYLLMSRVALPRISSILEERRKRVEADLAEAQRRKDESDATILAGEKALADARARAQTLADETHEKAAAAAEARRTQALPTNALGGKMQQRLTLCHFPGLFDRIIRRVFEKIT